MLISRSGQWRNDPAAREALDRLRRHPYVDSIALAKTAAIARLSSSCIRELGDRLSSERSAQARHPYAGRTYRVYFCDPNATKPLHIGHLRNIALGNAIAAALRHAGATAYRCSTVADIGQTVAEAMAGVAADGAGRPAPDEKSDHYVGRCYADYVSTLESDGPTQVQSAVDAPLGRELTQQADAATTLLNRLIEGDRKIAALSRYVRDLVVDGHITTLRRLGVSFDHVAFESDLLDAAAEVAEEGVANGLFTRDREGAVHYSTGVEEAPTICLVRPNGLPTQHLRCMALWIATERDIRDSTTLQLCGDEWGPHVRCTEPLLARLMHDTAPHPSHHLLHGLVTVDDEKVASSAGTPLTVDAMLDWLDAEALQRLRRAASGWDDGHRSCDQIDPSFVALNYFLMAPRRSTVTFNRDTLFDPMRSPGWLFTLARRRGGLSISGPEPDANDPNYRFSLVRAYAITPMLVRSLDSFDFSALMRSVTHFIGWSLSQPSSRSVANVAETVMRDTETIIGLRDPQAI